MAIWSDNEIAKAFAAQGMPTAPPEVGADGRTTLRLVREEVQVSIAPDRKTAEVQGVCTCGARLVSVLDYGTDTLTLTHGDGEARHTWTREGCQRQGGVGAAMRAWTETVHHYERQG